MKKLILAVFLLGGLAFGQAARYDNFAWSTQGVSFGTAITAVPGSSVQVCAFPANAVPCSNFATTYTDQTLTSTCPTNAQLTAQSGGGCQGAADAQGNFGFWAAPGAYDYTLCSGSGCAGPYHAFVPIGASTSGSVVQTLNGIRFADQYSTGLAGAVSACGSNPCAIAVSNSVAVSTITIPANITIVFLAGGKLTCASAATINFNGTLSAPEDQQIFGANCAASGLTLSRPEWFAGSSYPLAYSALSAAYNAVVSGGTLQLRPVGTYITTNGVIVTKSITVDGVKKPQVANDYSHLLVGTGAIFLGPFFADTSTGASSITFRNFGCDSSQTTSTTYFSGAGLNGCGFVNNGQVVGGGVSKGDVVEHIIGLGQNASAAFHALLFENMDNASFNDLEAYYNTFGIVFKTSNSTMTNLRSKGHSGACVYFKSDSYAVMGSNAARNIICGSIATNDTAGLQVQAATTGGAGNLISGYRGVGLTNFGVNVNTAGNNLTDTVLSDLNIDTVVGGNAWGIEVTGTTFRTTVTNAVINNTASAVVVVNSGVPSQTHFDRITATNCTSNCFILSGTDTKVANSQSQGSTGNDFQILAGQIGLNNNEGVVGSSGGVFTQGTQFVSASSCTTTASIGATCSTVLSWPISFTNGNYIVNCSLDDPNSPGHVTYLARTVGTIGPVIAADAAVATHGTITCVGSL